MTKLFYNIDPEYKKWGLIGLASSLIILLLIYKIYSYVIPQLSESIANKLPASVSQEIGEETLKALDEEQLTPSTLEDVEQARLTSLFNQLLPVTASSGSGYNKTESSNSDTSNTSNEQEQYTLQFRAHADIANAMALADGTVILTDKMITLAENDQQIAAVLLHEIGHIKHNHSIKNLVQMSVIALSMALLFGDITTLNVILIQGATMSTSFSYSRKAELEADLYATKMMHEHYGSAEEFIKILTLLEQDHLNFKNNKQHEEKNEDNDFANWFSTHPSVKARIAEIKRYSPPTH